MPKLSKYFSWEEVTFSQTASRTGIDNTLPESLKADVEYIATRMDELREILGSAVLINSWYRCPELNTAVGSSNTSQHIYGQAIDFVSPRYGKPYQICKALIKKKASLNWDQLILEHDWVHISFIPPSIPSVTPRNQVLSLLKSNKYSKGLTDVNGKPL